MSITNGIIENGTLTIGVSGHIDSKNAPDLEVEIEELLKDNDNEKIIIDAQNLEYISSAGLRVILRLRKKNESTKIINASPEVYEIFSMTGFTEIMEIEKAYRELSIDGCEVIGQGANGKVYRLDADTIIKVYMDPDSLDDIHRERELARKAFVLGIPTAIPYDVAKVGDKYGSVFELLNAQSFSKLIAAHPEDIMKYIKLYVELLKKIHSTEVKPCELPDMREIAIGWADYFKGEIPDELWQKLHSMLVDIKTDNHMLHGDYHTKNVMLQNGEVLLIDMDTLGVGNPILEFANMFNAYVGYEETMPDEEKGKFLGLNYEQCRTIWEETVKLYFDTDDEQKIREITNKSKVIGYTRILRRTMKRSADTKKGKELIDHCREQLIKIIPEVNSLSL